MNFKHKIPNSENYLYCESFGITLEEVHDKGLESPCHFIVNIIDKNNSFLTKGIASFSFSGFSGCNSIVISHNTYLSKAYRGTSISDAFRALKTKVAKSLKFSVMIATANSEDEPARKNMEKSGYEIVSEFLNEKTSHLVVLGIKEL